LKTDSTIENAQISINIDINNYRNNSEISESSTLANNRMSRCNSNNYISENNINQYNENTRRNSDSNNVSDYNHSNDNSNSFISEKQVKRMLSGYNHRLADQANKLKFAENKSKEFENKFISLSEKYLSYKNMSSEKQIELDNQIK